MYRTSNSTYGSHNSQHSLGKQPVSIANQKPIGLENLKNTCYISAVLQILFLILPESLLKAKGKITGHFFKLKTTRDTKDYKLFKKEVETIIEIVQGYDQQDAQEFLIGFIDVLDKESSELVKLYQVDLDYKKNYSLSDNYQNFVSEMKKIEKSPIVDLFSGELVRQFRCVVNQKHLKYKFERFQVVSLSFPSPSSFNSTITLDELIKIELRKENISDLDCEQCHRKSDFEKETFYYRLPNYLILHLARFKKGYFNNEKINTNVEFNEEILISEEIKKLRAKYRLIGTVNHSGTLDQGHYFAEVRHTNGQWYEVNDEVVKPSNMSPQKNNSKKVYILFYERLK